MSYIYNAIKSNGWKVHLFPIEVGARGYCSTSVKSCLQRLGFSNKQVRTTLKSLSFTSLKSSFNIWQARESKNWTKPTVSNIKTGKTTDITHHTEKFVKVDETVSFSKCTAKVSIFNCGLKNRGTTCYINASLQCFSTMDRLWSKISLLSNKLSPFINSFVKLMSL